MTIEHGIPYSFISQQAIYGTHDLSADTIKMALYGASASLSLAGTTAYTTSGEFSGSGYSAGGDTLSLTSGYPKMNTAAAMGVNAGAMMLLDFQDKTFTGLTGSVRGAMIYNSTRANKVIALLDFGITLNLSGNNLLITWPDPSVNSAIIRAS